MGIVRLRERDAVRIAVQELGRPEVFVTSFPPTGGKWNVSIDGGSLPMWRSNEEELFYLAPDGAPRHLR
jgi:hypothetical protein